MGQGTTRELFEIVLGAEREARSLYKGLAIMFHTLDVARDFFASMQKDEEEHIKSICSMMDFMTQGQLDREAEKSSLVIAKSFLNFKAEEVLSTVVTLDDAYKAAMNLEFSEVNKLHELLLELHMGNAERRNILEAELRAHASKVREFRDSGVDMTYRPLRA